jgi:hypothetical protein
MLRSVQRQSCQLGGYGFRACAQERASRNDGALRNRPGIKKAGSRPAVFVGNRPAQAEREAPPEPFKLLLLGFLCLLGLLRCLLLRFLSHSILVWVNGWKRDSEACSGRASLATASIHIRTDSLAPFPRRHSGVITLSTAVLRFCAFLAAYTVIASQRVARMRADDRLREAIQSPGHRLDCFVASAPRNDGECVPRHG